MSQYWFNWTVLLVNNVFCAVSTKRPTQNYCTKVKHTRVKEVIIIHLVIIQLVCVLSSRGKIGLVSVFKTTLGLFGLHSWHWNPQCVYMRQGQIKQINTVFLWYILYVYTNRIANILPLHLGASQFSRQPLEQLPEWLSHTAFPAHFPHWLLQSLP